MSLSGPLYRRTPRLFNKNKPGDWTLVWCELPLETGDGELIVYQEQHSRRKLVTIPVKDCDIAHVRSDGRDCIEITISKSKKETFSSHESSFDVDWWYEYYMEMMNTLLSVKRDLELGIRPRAFIVCPPTQEAPARYKSIKRAPSSHNMNAGASVVRPTLRRRQPTLAAGVALLERFTIYETATTFYVVCSDRHYSRFRLLELNRMVDRPQSLKEILTEDSTVYPWKEMEAKLQLLTDLAKTNGGGKLVRAFTAVAIVGCIRFLKDYYFIFVTQRRKIGCIGGNFVYGISATHQLNVSKPNQDSSAWTWLNRWFNPSPEEEAEARYLGLFHFMDLTKDFFFSYSYDITHTLQHNMTRERSEPSEMFTWNSYLTHELKEYLSPEAASDLVIPIVLGSYEQRKCSVFGRLISIILLARRSRHFAGTRYLKRGVADTGKAANDVETEQIIEDENMGAGKLSSFVQYRGSIPVFWSQETSATLPKPPIVLNRVDPTYTASRKHFADLFSRYGSPIVALNLVKQSEKKEREVLVGKEYLNAVEYLNSFMPPAHQIRYVALDYSRMSKQKTLDVYKSLDKFAVWALAQTGFFCSAPKRHVGKNANKRSAKVHFAHNGTHSAYGLGSDEHHDTHIDEPPLSPTIPRKSGDWLEQKGVLRTNCIDCLDRTNVSQFAVGMRALGQQLYAMGIRNTPLIENSSQLVRVLTQLYSLVGDAISMQYGGSEAHKNVNNVKAVKNTATIENFKHRELLTSIRRYYSNSFTDMAKQDAINIFLGHYVPKEGQPPLWELENDYYLHNFEVRNGAAACEEMRKSVAWQLESRRKPYDDGLLSPTGTTSSNEYEFVDEIDEEPTMEHVRDQQRREAYIRECKRLLEDWWREPLEKFEQPRYAMSKIRSQPRLEAPEEKDSDGEDDAAAVIEIGADTADESGIKEAIRAMQATTCAPCSDEFIQMYHPEELTSFEKTLGYKFMNPLESHDQEKARSESAGSESLASMSGSTPTNMRGSHGRSTSTEDVFDNSMVSRRFSSKYLGHSRTARSMSAPECAEEHEQVDSTRRGRDSAHEGRTAPLNDDDRYGVDSRGFNRGYQPGNGILKGVLKHPGDELADPHTHSTRYVQSQKTPLIWENDSENVRMFFESYLRENHISADDARSLREAQVRGGATYKIQTGVYAGLDQNVKVREIIALKGLKTSADERKFFQDTLDFKKLVQTGKSSIPVESLELYESFFDDDLPDVSIYVSPKHSTTAKGNYVSFASSSITADSPPHSSSSSSGAADHFGPDAATTALRQHKPPTRKIIGPHGVRFGDCEMISLGALYQLVGGREQDFIRFNEAAAENSFGDVMKNEYETTYHQK
uniref:SAC domain-containing protein n=1 Tax=Globisporangium ultimum (strain ATCC 200006 / CBS 805.95 / DAOM BR144) TaxID=431595 RepID=K3X291_GLOUD